MSPPSIVLLTETDANESPLTEIMKQFSNSYPQFSESMVFLNINEDDEVNKLFEQNQNISLVIFEINYKPYLVIPCANKIGTKFGHNINQVVLCFHNEHLYDNYRTSMPNYLARALLCFHKNKTDLFCRADKQAFSDYLINYSKSPQTTLIQ